METITEPTTTVMVLSCRKPGSTFEHFKSYYENKHVPLVGDLLMKGDLRPLSYTRSYIGRDLKDGEAPSFPFGHGDTWEWDCIARVVFRDAKHRDALFAEFGKHRETIAQDEAQFLDSSKLRIIYISESPSTVPKD